MIKRKTYKKIIAFLLIVSLNVFVAPGVKAGELVNESDVMTSLDASALSSHDITFTLAGSNTFVAAETITVDFGEDSSYFAVGAGSVIADFDFNDGTERVIFAVADGAVACGASSGVNDIAVGVDATTGIVTFMACVNFVASGAGATINIEYGVAAGGTNMVTNPTAQNDVPIYIIESGADSGSLAVSIIADDSVTVSATVDPTFTFAIDSTTCALGTLSTGSVSTCTYTITTSTNAEDGYTTTIIEDGNLRDGTPDIDDVADGTVTAASEEYGASSNDADSLDIITTAGDAASPITGTAQSIAQQAAGPVSADAVIVTHHASIAAITVAGSYSHIVTLISTGTF